MYIKSTHEVLNVIEHFYVDRTSKGCLVRNPEECHKQNELVGMKYTVMCLVCRSGFHQVLRALIFEPLLCWGFHKCSLLVAATVQATSYLT
jgi:hypothetical protein